jgi:putative transposase
MWHHRPAHVFEPDVFYMVTAGTLHKEHFYQGDDRLGLLQAALQEVLGEFQWALQAWAVFPNHYHFIAQAPADASSLKPAIQKLHSVTAREINRRDQTGGRRVWFQFWDTCLTYERSYLVRLHYVNNNAVHHGLVSNAMNYPFCSATWFELHSEPSFRRKVQSFRWDRLRIVDDF